MYDVEIYETRAQWLPQRGLGGSDAACIAGLNQYKPPVQLWAELTGKVERESGNPVTLAVGRQLEPLTIELMDEALGQEVHIWRPGARRGDIAQVRSRERPHATYTPDAVVLAGERPAWHQVVAPVEAKHTSVEKSWESRGSAGAVRAEIQLHHGFSVLGEEGDGYICAILGNRDFTWHPVPYDQDAVDWLIELEDQFLDMVQRDIPPDFQFSEEGARILGKLLPWAKATVVELGGAAGSAAKELKQAIASRQLYEKREKELRQEVMHYALAEAGIVGEPNEDAKLRIETPSGNWSWTSSMRKGYEVKAARVASLRPLKGKS